MKIASRILSVVVLVVMATFYVGCNKSTDPGPSDTDTQIEALNASWYIANTGDVTLDGAAPTLDHKDMTLTITGTPGNQTVQYTVTKRPIGPSAWPAQGSLTFDATNPKTTLKREDNVVITYSVDGTKLKMDFTFAGDAYQSTSGRIQSVAGKWVFNFTKK
jgi:hypothetical protein